MSEQSGGPGWWLASDGKWYPPQQEPDAAPASEAAPDAASPASKPKWWARPVPLWSLVIAALLGLGLGAASAASSSEDDNDAAPSTSTTEADEADPETTTTAEPTETTTTVPTAAGDQDDPLPLGTAADVGEDWNVTVTEVGDGTAAIMETNEFNEPPPSGSIYVLVRFSATYQGDTEGNAGFELTVGYVGSDNRVYEDTSCSVVTPDDMIDQPAVVAGGTATGTQCLTVPADVFGTGALFVEPIFSFEDDARIWWV